MAEIKQMEVDRLRGMAEAEAIPRARLEQARPNSLTPSQRL
ncbi:MAG: hypothetical protein SGI92_03055 [Bryobacteraceae bacterium]|nr:hypothetical protein [Bryobacteraceae bacterium]